MHIHTLYSDGDKTLEEVLEICEHKKIDYISITDHNTCEAYKDNIWKKKIYTGKVVCGVEMNAFLDNGKRIELLGYNIKNTNIINEWSQHFYSEKGLQERFIRDKQKIIDICDKNHFIYDIDAIKKDIPYTDFYVVYMYYELIKYPENVKKMGECAKSFNDFRKLGLSNSKSIFYMGEDNSSKPMLQDVANIIHQAGGLVFLAHPFEYKFEDTIGFIDQLQKK